eukprot:GHVR01007410.1.p1 GENE.GHVR01007410.1~~GHVR01007410.1.p1  ORF type:complete len:105 (-),score=8.24 GHVR01007410.1:188-502(-)
MTLPPACIHYWWDGAMFTAGLWVGLEDKLGQCCESEKYFVWARTISKPQVPVPDDIPLVCIHYWGQCPTSMFVTISHYKCFDVQPPRPLVVTSASIHLGHLIIW